MLVREIMTENPMCCRPETSCREVARMMVECDCGEIPVIDETGKPLGVVTDRDITCRLVAEGLDSSGTHASEVMTSPVVNIHEFGNIAEACKQMEDTMIRRIVVTDDAGRVCGMLTLADIALRAPGFAEEIVEEVSQPTREPSRVHS